uniref:Uncharacterized protein n=1 Tax=Picea sitchensis TaxID=3332 RepID=A9NWH7_PICSI|nr:unknown [Picea sitchensis]
MEILQCQASGGYQSVCHLIWGGALPRLLPERGHKMRRSRSSMERLARNL